MCLMMFAWQSHARFALVLGANRDEFRGRPTAPASWWPDRPEILAGRDLSAYGTWLGMNRDGHFAALTNIRHKSASHAGRRSRGALVVASLLGEEVDDKSAYAGYNLLYGEPAGGRLYIDGNRTDQKSLALGPGLYGLSNAALDDPWPKTIQAKTGLQGVLEAPCEAGHEPEMLIAGILGLLDSRTTYPDAELPDTGVGLDRERDLSPLFIDLKEYGTRSSTVILVEHSGAVHFTERSFDGPIPTTLSYSFSVTRPVTLA